MLKNIKELGKDSLVYGLGSSLSQLVALFLVPFYSRVLSPVEYGVLAMAGLATQFVNPVLSLGLDNALFRYWAMSDTEAERRAYVTTAAVLKNSVMLLFLVVFYFSYTLFNLYLFQGHLAWEVFWLLLPSLFLSSFGSISEVLIRVQRRPEILLAVQIPSMAIGVSLSVWWVLFLHWGVFGSIAASLSAQVFAAVAYSYYLGKYLRPASFSRESARTLLRYSLPYVPHRLQAQVMQWFSLFMVNQHMGIAMAGIYSMVGKFVKPINLLVDSVQRAWVPYKFQVHKKEANPAAVFRSLIGNYWLLLLLLWGGACIVFPWVFKWLIDPKYHSGIPFFPFLAMIPLAQVLNYTLTVGIELRDSQKALPIGSFFGLATVVLGTFATVSFWSPYGPILSHAASFCASAVVVYQYSRKTIRVDFPFAALGGLLVLETALVAAFYLTGGVLKYLLAVGLAALLLPVAVKAFGAINPEFSIKTCKQVCA